jgi:hypothetical protein
MKTAQNIQSSKGISAKPSRLYFFTSHNLLSKGSYYLELALCKVCGLSKATSEPMQQQDDTNAP